MSKPDDVDPLTALARRFKKEPSLLTRFEEIELRTLLYAQDLVIAFLMERLPGLADPTDRDRAETKLHDAVAVPTNVGPLQDRIEASLFRAMVQIRLSRLIGAVPEDDTAEGLP